MTTTSLPASTASTAPDARRPEATRRPAARRPALTLAFACAAMCVSYLPFSASGAALGAIARTTGAGTDGLQWVSDGFAVALGATVLAAGALADRFGRRLVTLAGLALTAVGALVDLAAGWLPAAAEPLLRTGQAISGVGGGAVMSASLALVATVAPDAAARGRWISAWAAAVVLGLGIGPFLTAGVTAVASWPWVYAPVALTALLIAAAGARWSQEAAGTGGGRLDVPGQLTGAGGVAVLVHGVIAGGSRGWTSPSTLAPLAAAVALLALFLAIERRASAPVLRPGLFRSAGFDAAALAATAVLFTIAGGLFVLSLHFAAQGVPPLGIALRLGSLFAGNAVASVLAGYLQARLRPRTLLVSGLVLAGAGTLSLLSTTATTDLTGFAWRLALTGVGGGLVMATTSAVAVQSVAPQEAGMAGAANNALRQLGAALGPALLGSVLASRLQDGAGQAAALHGCAVVMSAVLLTAALLTAVLLRSRTRA